MGCSDAACAGPAVARPRVDKTRRYVCPNVPGVAGCGGIAILAEPLEELIRETVFESFDEKFDPIITAQASDKDEAERLRDLITADETALEGLTTDHYVNRVIDRANFLKAQEQLTARIDANQRALHRAAGQTALSGLRGVDAVREAWDARDRAAHPGRTTNSTSIASALLKDDWAPEK